MAICKLCLEDKPLIKKSHIIPDFMYQNVFEKGGKLEVFSPKDLWRENLGGDKAKMKSVSSGEYEGGLLCKDCDNNVIGKYESYASKTLYSKTPIPPSLAPICKNWMDPEDSTVRFSHCRNIDYRKFKLFLLSILWKASISKRLFFAEVNLGLHEELIRKMLHNDDPKSIQDYPVIMAWLDPEKETLPLVAQPIKKLMNDDLTIYQFIIDKAILNFPVASEGNKLVDLFADFTIRPNNTMKIPHLPPGKANEFILRHSGVSQTILN